MGLTNSGKGSHAGLAQKSQNMVEIEISMLDILQYANMTIIWMERRIQYLHSLVVS